MDLAVANAMDKVLILAAERLRHQMMPINIY
jgi:hypothetical protein